jgi:tetratricopeptide (TPR) repeat protein
MSAVKRYVALAALGGLALLVAAVLLVRGGAGDTSDDSRAAHEHSHQGITLMQRHLYHAAIEEFEAAIQKSPRSLDPPVGLAAIYIRLGNGPKALEEAGKAVNLASESVDVQLIFGRAHWLARNFNDAETAALKVDKLDPSNPHAAELLLRIYFDRKDDAKFREVLDRTSKPNRAIQDLAVQFAIRRGEFKRAYELRNSFDRERLESETFRTQLSLKREPDRTDLYPGLVQNLIRLGRFDEAITTRNEYRGSVPLDLEMGHAYWAGGDLDKATRAYTRASLANTHKLSAEAALAIINRGRKHWLQAFRAEWVEKDYFVLGRLEGLLETATPIERALIYRYAGIFDRELFNQAAREALSVLDAQPDEFDALMTLGTAYLRLDRIDDAVRYVQQGADQHPERAEVWSRLGQLFLAKGDVGEAERSFQRAVQLEPSNASYLYNYGWLLDQADRDADAALHYERAIAASSLSFEAMNNLALIEAAKGRTSRALSLLDRAVASNPGNENSYLNRANYYATVRRWNDALADYARASELNPLSAFAFVESARTHLELNRADIAIDELNAALDVDPRAPDAYVLLAAAYEKQGRKTEAAAALVEARRIKGAL